MRDTNYCERAVNAAAEVTIQPAFETHTPAYEIGWEVCAVLLLVFVLTVKAVRNITQ